MSGGYKRGSISMLGATHIQCVSPQCLKWNETNTKPYSHFSLFDKSLFYSGIILRSFLFGGPFGFLIFFEFFDNIWVSLIGAITGSFILFKIVMWFKKHEINEIEKEQSKMEEHMKKPVVPISKEDQETIGKLVDYFNNKNKE